MNTTPASAALYRACHPGQVIGLFLVRLFAYLLRRETAGETVVHPDIAYMVASADRMVHAFICTLIAAQLKQAGYSAAARPLAHAARSVHTEQAQGFPGSSREPAVRIEQAQGCLPASPTELLERLQTTMEKFERAEAVANLLAGFIVCVLACVSPQARRPRVYTGVTASTGKPSVCSMRCAVPPWPPPSRKLTAPRPAT